MIKTLHIVASLLQDSKTFSPFEKLIMTFPVPLPEAGKAKNFASFHVMPFQQAERHFLASQHVNHSKLFSIIIL